MAQLCSSVRSQENNPLRFTPQIPVALDNLLHIFSFLDPTSLRQCSKVCTGWKVLSERDFIWKPLFHKHFPLCKNIYHQEKVPFKIQFKEETLRVLRSKNLQEGKYLSRRWPELGEEIVEVALSQKGKISAFTKEGKVRIFDVKTSSEKILSFQGGLKPLMMHELADEKIAIECEYGIVLIWDVGLCKCLGQLEAGKDIVSIKSIDIDHYVVIGKNCAEVHSLSQGKAISHFSFTSTCVDCFPLNTKWMIVALRSGELVLVDIGEQKEKKRVNFDQNAFLSPFFFFRSPNKIFFKNNRQLIAWDIEKNEQTLLRQNFLFEKAVGLSNGNLLLSRKVSNDYSIYMIFNPVTEKMTSEENVCADHFADLGEDVILFSTTEGVLKVVKFNFMQNKNNTLIEFRDFFEDEIVIKRAFVDSFGIVMFVHPLNVVTFLDGATTKENIRLQCAEYLEAYSVYKKWMKDFENLELSLKELVYSQLGDEKKNSIKRTYARTLPEISWQDQKTKNIHNLVHALNKSEKLLSDPNQKTTIISLAGELKSITHIDQKAYKRYQRLFPSYKPDVESRYENRQNSIEMMALQLKDVKANRSFSLPHQELQSVEVHFVCGQKGFQKKNSSLEEYLIQIGIYSEKTCMETFGIPFSIFKKVGISSSKDLPKLFLSPLIFSTLDSLDADCKAPVKPLKTKIEDYQYYSRLQHLNLLFGKLNDYAKRRDASFKEFLFFHLTPEEIREWEQFLQAIEKKKNQLEDSMKSRKATLELLGNDSSLDKWKEEIHAFISEFKKFEQAFQTKLLSLYFNQLHLDRIWKQLRSKKDECSLASIKKEGWKRTDFFSLSKRIVI